MLIFTDGTRLVLEHSKGDREEGLHGLKPWEATATQSLIQMMSREVLVLEEKELVCVEVRRKTEGGRLTKPEKRVDSSGRRDGARVRAWKRKEGGTKGETRQLHAARDQAGNGGTRPERTIPSPGNTHQHAGSTPFRLAASTLKTDFPPDQLRDDKELKSRG